MTNRDIANTILEQLGGNRFRAMTGAKSFSAGERSLAFRLSSRLTRDKIACVRITLGASDTYAVEFLAIRGLKVVVVDMRVDVFCDQLQDVFTQVTGLQTRL